MKTTLEGLQSKLCSTPLDPLPVGTGCPLRDLPLHPRQCDWNPAESDLEDIAQSMGVGEAICTMREVVAVVNRPQDIEDEEAMSFFGGSEGNADESQG